LEQNRTFMNLAILALVLATSSHAQDASGPHIGASFADKAFGHTPKNSSRNEPPTEYAGQSNSNPPEYYPNDRQNNFDKTAPRNRQSEREEFSTAGMGFPEASLARAIRILERSNLDGDEGRIVQRMLAKARTIRLVISSTGHCSRGAAASANGNTINICSRGFFVTPRLDYGQHIILHELTHVAGVHGNECRSDQIARMLLEEARQPFVPSSYDPGCRGHN
jgi:hypothetical protein